MRSRRGVNIPHAVLADRWSVAAYVRKTVVFRTRANPNTAIRATWAGFVRKLMSETLTSKSRLSVGYGTVLPRERTFGLREGFDR